MFMIVAQVAGFAYLVFAAVLVVAGVYAQVSGARRYKMDFKYIMRHGVFAPTVEGLFWPGLVYDEIMLRRYWKKERQKQAVLKAQRA